MGLESFEKLCSRRSCGFWGDNDTCSADELRAKGYAIDERFQQCRPRCVREAEEIVSQSGNAPGWLIGCAKAFLLGSMSVGVLYAIGAAIKAAARILQ